MISVYLATVVASFIFIFLKSFQQRNVVFEHYAWIVPTSMTMAAAEVYVIARVAETGFGPELVLAIGLGSGTGCLASVIIHKKLLGKK